LVTLDTVPAMGTVYKDNRTLQVTAERIRSIRMGRGITIESFAEAIETQPTNVRRLESGTENISLVRLARIAGVLGVQMVDLLIAPPGQLADELGALGFDVLSAEKAPSARDVAIWDVRPRAGAPSPTRTFEPVRLGWARPRRRRRTAEAMFLLQITGDSMAPVIPDGAWCLFRQPVREARLRLRVLVQLLSLDDPTWVVKQIGSVESSADGATRIRLDSLNPAHAPSWVLLRDDGDAELIGELVEVLGP
jgi:transcriptional regulator with XRE-family HTH domain